MDQDFFQYMKRLSRLLSYLASNPFVWFGHWKNRASYSARSPFIHLYSLGLGLGYGYVFVGDRTDYLAGFPVRSESFMNYPG